MMMPSYVNIGAYVGEDTMVDTWATVGVVRADRRRVHLSGGVGIGGVLEPPQAVPVVIDDDTLHRVALHDRRRRAGRQRASCSARARSSPASIPVIDAETGEEVSRGVVPDWCVAVPAHPAADVPRRRVRAAVRARPARLTEGERHDKSKLNEILREHGVTT